MLFLSFFLQPQQLHLTGMNTKNEIVTGSLNVLTAEVSAFKEKHLLDRSKCSELLGSCFPLQLMLQM